MYCLRCKRKTETNNQQQVMSNGLRPRPLLKSTCVQCGCKKCTFIGGKLDIHSLIGKLPRHKGGFT